MSDNALDFEAIKQQAIADLKEGKSLMGEDGALTPLIKDIIEASLEGEMASHFQQEGSSSNRRNGKQTKQVKSASGQFELATPRDRDGAFEPELVQKRQTILNESFDNKILGLFKLGMSYDAIQSHLMELYGVEVATGTISRVTDPLMPIIKEWRSRPLASVYPIIFLDAMWFKTRENGKVVQKAIYMILGIDQQGYKDILGFYSAETEGANFWLNVLNDLQNRGVQDILIACVDGLTGFPEAIQTAFPKTEIQLCVVHQIRQSLRYVASKDKQAFLNDLKAVYEANTKEQAEENLLRLEENWGHKYPAVTRSWQNKWEHLSAYFKYPKPIRRLIYTTNPIEGFHRQVRKYTKSKGAFTSEDALFKSIYAAIEKIMEKWTMPLSNWAYIVSQLDIQFEGRLELGL
jgi:transposase-like protein